MPAIMPAKSAEAAPADVKMTMVITMRSGTQIRAGVKDADVRRSSLEGKLTGVNWTTDDDPFGSSIGYVDVGEVAAVHFERERRAPDAIVTQR